MAATTSVTSVPGGRVLQYRAGLWISVRRDNPNLWNRLARALAAVGQPAPALVS